MYPIADDYDRDYIATKIVVTIFKVMGLAPFIVRKFTRDKIRKRRAWQNVPTMQFSTSHCGWAYALCLIASQVCLLMLKLQTTISDVTFYETSLHKGIDVAACMFGYFTIFLIWLIFGFRQEIIVGLLNRLLNFESAILGNKDGRRLKTSRFFAVRLCLTNIVMIAALLIGDYLAYGLLPTTYVMYIVPTTVASWFLTHYAFVVKMIENGFKALNRSLRDCCVPTFVPLSHRRYDTRKFFGIGTTAQNVATLRRAHLNLCGTAGDVSSFYSVPVLFTITYCCYSLIVSAYYLIQPIVARPNDNGFIVILSALIWISQMLIAVAVLSTGVTNVVNESQVTSDIVKRLLSHSDNSHAVNVELEDFSLQLLHQDIRFTACGLFQLDLTLVHSIIGVVITYITILIQIQKRNSIRNHEVTKRKNDTESN